MKSIRKVELRWKSVGLVKDGEDVTYGKQVQSSKDVHRIAEALIGDEVVEVFIVFMLTNKNRIIGYHEVARGGLSACAMTPSEVYRAAISSAAAAVVVVHNHPSGQTTPSSEDIAFTRRLKKAGELLGINLLDHVIIGEDEFFSFIDAGMLTGGDDAEAGAVSR